MKYSSFAAPELNVSSSNYSFQIPSLNMAFLDQKCYQLILFLLFIINSPLTSANWQFKSRHDLSPSNPQHHNSSSSHYITRLYIHRPLFLAILVYQPPIRAYPACAVYLHRHRRTCLVGIWIFQWMGCEFPISKG